MENFPIVISRQDWDAITLLLDMASDRYLDRAEEVQLENLDIVDCPQWRKNHVKSLERMSSRYLEIRENLMDQVKNLIRDSIPYDDPHESAQLVEERNQEIWEYRDEWPV